MTVRTNHCSRESDDGTSSNQLESGLLVRAYPIPISPADDIIIEAGVERAAQVVAVGCSEDANAAAASSNGSSCSLPLQAEAILAVTSRGEEIDVEANQTSSHNDNSNEGGIRASIVSVSLTKKAGEMSLGLGFDFNDRGFLSIAAISPGGALEVSPFQVGDKILTINGKACIRDTWRSVVSHLATSTGTLTVVARNERGDPGLVEAMVEKPHSQCKPGISLIQGPGSRLVVSEILPGGLFSGSALRKGDEVISMNGVDCRSASVSAAYDIIDEATRFVTVVATTGGTGTTPTDVERNKNTCAKGDRTEEGARRTLSLCIRLVILSCILAYMACRRDYPGDD